MERRSDARAWQLSARGGPAGGDGGVVETPGGFPGCERCAVSATAPIGKRRVSGCWIPPISHIVAGDANDNIDEEAGCGLLSRLTCRH